MPRAKVDRYALRQDYNGVRLRIVLSDVQGDGGSQPDPLATRWADMFFHPEDAHVPWGVRRTGDELRVTVQDGRYERILDMLRNEDDLTFWWAENRSDDPNAREYWYLRTPGADSTQLHLTSAPEDDVSRPSNSLGDAETALGRVLVDVLLRQPPSSATREDDIEADIVNRLRSGLLSALDRERGLPR